MATGQVTVPAGVTFERRQPARAPGREDVVVNWMYSLGSAVVWTLAGVVAALLLRQKWPIILGICLGVASFVLLWFVLLFESRRLLWLMETATGQDLDGDWQVGQPTTDVNVRKTVRVALDDGEQVLYRESGLEDYQVEAVAYAVLDGDAGFSRRSLCVEHNCFPAEIYGRVRLLWIRAGLLEPVTEAPNAAVNVTAVGYDFLRQSIGR